MMRHARCYRDWRSDVCSSELMRRHTRCYRDWSSDVCSSDRSEEHTSNSSHGSISYAVFCLDRKSVGLGKSVDLGGRRIIKKKKRRKRMQGQVRQVASLL